MGEDGIISVKPGNVKIPALEKDTTTSTGLSVDLSTPTLGTSSLRPDTFLDKTDSSHLLPAEAVFSPVRPPLLSATAVRLESGLPAGFPFPLSPAQHAHFHRDILVDTKTLPDSDWGYLQTNELLAPSFREVLPEVGSGIYLGLDSVHQYAFIPTGMDYILFLDYSKSVQALHGLYRGLFLISPSRDDFLRNLQAYLSAREPRVVEQLAQVIPEDGLEIIDALQPELEFERLAPFVPNNVGYPYLRHMHLMGRVRFIRANATDEKAMSAVGEIIRNLHSAITIFYNTILDETIPRWHGRRAWEAYRRSFLSLPIADKAFVLSTRSPIWRMGRFQSSFRYITRRGDIAVAHYQQSENIRDYFGRYNNAIATRETEEKQAVLKLTHEDLGLEPVPFARHNEELRAPAIIITDLGNVRADWRQILSDLDRSDLVPVVQIIRDLEDDRRLIDTLNRIAQDPANVAWLYEEVCEIERLNCGRADSHKPIAVSRWNQFIPAGAATQAPVSNVIAVNFARTVR